MTQWVNINAEPPREGFEDRLNLSDLVARIGGKPSSVPKAYADRNFIVRRRHEDLAGMMQDAEVGDFLGPHDGKTALSDDLDAAEWNRRRNEQVRGRGSRREER